MTTDDKVSDLIQDPKAWQEGYAAFDDSYVWLGSAQVGNVFPASLVLVAIVFALFTFIMHGTVYGRLCYVIGNNARAARLSGVRVPLIKVAAFAIGGVTASLASLVYVGQYQSARADNASDILLFIVSAVVLGGVDIFGGRGNVVGVLLALLLLGTLKNGMGLANFPGPVQTLTLKITPGQVGDFKREVKILTDLQPEPVVVVVEGTAAP